MLFAPWVHDISRAEARLLQGGAGSGALLVFDRGAVSVALFLVEPDAANRPRRVRNRRSGAASAPAPGRCRGRAGGSSKARRPTPAAAIPASRPPARCGVAEGHAEARSQPPPRRSAAPIPASAKAPERARRDTRHFERNRGSPRAGGSRLVCQCNGAAGFLNSCRGRTISACPSKNAIISTSRMSSSTRPEAGFGLLLETLHERRLRGAPSSRAAAFTALAAQAP
jgi:hypothetical protein